MEIQILSQEPRILVGDRLVELGPPKERLVLAVLAHSAGKVVPLPALIDRVWGQDAPSSIRTSVYSHITRIRNRLRSFGVDLPLVSRSHGYVLDIDPDTVDLNRVHRLYKEAGKRIGEGEFRPAGALLEQALGMWDGDPLTELQGDWAASARKVIEQTRVRVLVRWAEAQAHLGQYDEVLDRLIDACADHPGNDSLTYCRMRALAASNRQTEAIECYNELRDYHRRENGADPNERTQKLFHEILAEERRARVPPVVPAQPPPRGASPYPVPGVEAASQPHPDRPVVYDNLELGVPDFVTREGELAGLLARVRSGRDTTVVEVVEGTPGVGKSSFILRAAHLLRNEFDVRAHLRLRGVGRPVEPTHVLHRLLTGLDVPKEDIPPDLESRAALWRIRAARHRVLLLVDDAVPGQVGPLLPSTPGCAVLVSSRTSLTDLDGAHRLVLGRLDMADSATMFEAFTGRVPDGPGGRRLLTLLGGLPLGLRLVAGRLRRHRTWTLGYLADRIARNGIAEVAVGDRDLASVFDLSYSDLDASARSAFLSMGLHPTGEVSLNTLAAMSGSWDRAEGAIEELLDAHLVEETAPGTHRMHALLHDYARRRADVLLHPAESRGVRRRLLDHCLAVTDAADRTALPGRRRWEPSHECEYLPEFADARAARAWFSTALPGIEVAVSYAKDHGFTGHVARIPLAAAGLLDTDGPWDRAEALHTRSVAAWRAIGRGPGLAQALCELGRSRWRLRDDSAEEVLCAALQEWERCGAEREYGRSLTLDQLGVLRYQAGDNEGALDAYHRALEGFLSVGEQEGVARALNHIGVSQNRLGRYEVAEAALAESMALYKALGDPRSEAQVLVNAARIHFHRGRHREVRRMCERGLDAFRGLGDVRSVAQTLNNLGQLADYLQRFDEALAHFRESKELFRGIGDTAEEVNADAGIGSSLLGLGRVPEAYEAVTAALVRIRALRDPMVEAHLLVVLGDVLVARRRFAEARLQYHNARELAGGGVSRLDEGLAWDRLGDLCSREGRTGAANEHWEQAVAILDAVPTPHCASVRMKLEVAGLLSSDPHIAL